MNTAITAQSNAHNAVIALALAATTVIPSTYSLEFGQSSTLRIEAVASFAPKTKISSFRGTPLATTQEMIANLRKEGLPISAIAEVMRVERKSIYSWLSGGEMRTVNTQRAAQLHNLFTGVAGVNARGVYRFWNRPVNGKTTLHDLMVAENIDETAVTTVLNTLRPAALRAIEVERKMTRQGNTNPVLDDLAEAGANA